MQDEYLVSGANLSRLQKEYFKYGSLAIAFDFDNTVYDYHQKGYTYQEVIQLLRDLKKYNCVMICFTANQDHEFVRQYCLTNDIPLDKLNENADFFPCESRKIYYNAFLDDRAGLIQMYNELKELITYIQYNQNDIL
jgi:FMN phosphatase YigB (HAD superfamily)